MDLQRAADILEIDILHITNISIIKKQYHKLALLHHPDKNTNKDNSHSKFILINESYEYLTHYSAEKEPVIHDFSYTNIIDMFIKTIFKDSQYEPFIEIIKNIVLDCSNISIKLFEGMDKYICIELYDFITKYKHILHISPEMLENIKNIILNKFEKDEIYILNPSLDDLLDGNVFKLTVQNKLYYVPLWHNELYYNGIDENGDECEIIVKCIPELPSHIQIIENNHIIVKITLPLNAELLNKEYIRIPFGKSVLEIIVSDLFIKKKQVVTLKRQGICQIMDVDIYNITNKSDIIVHIEMV